jgi:hypothetical protein
MHDILGYFYVLGIQQNFYSGFSELRDHRELKEEFSLQYLKSSLASS